MMVILHNITITLPVSCNGNEEKMCGAVVAAQSLDSFEGSDLHGTVPHQHLKADS